ncbi:MAG: hypothetical protein JNL01_07550 [Bdellovibrionales bacterium]|nr:hypothetical protein [Bdellovibrionales bacterium]
MLQASGDSPFKDFLPDPTWIIVESPSAVAPSLRKLKVAFVGAPLTDSAVQELFLKLTQAMGLSPDDFTWIDPTAGPAEKILELQPLTIVVMDESLELAGSVRTLHPSQILRSADPAREKRKVWNDLQPIIQRIK